MQAYKIMAKNVNTSQRIQQQFLDGGVITDREEAMHVAQSFAQQVSDRRRETWIAEVKLYTVGFKPGSQT